MFDLSVGQRGLLLPDLYDNPSFNYLNLPSNLERFYAICRIPNRPIEVKVNAVYLVKNIDGDLDYQRTHFLFVELTDVWIVNENPPVWGWTLLAKDVHLAKDLGPLNWRTSCFTSA